MSEGIRIELAGELEGHYLVLRPRCLTLGLLEDLQSENAKAVLDALSDIILAGDLPNGIDRKGLRRLTVEDLKSVMQAIRDVSTLPKQR